MASQVVEIGGCNNPGTAVAVRDIPLMGLSFLSHGRNSWVFLLRVSRFQIVSFRFVPLGSVRSVRFGSVGFGNVRLAGSVGVGSGGCGCDVFRLVLSYLSELGWILIGAGRWGSPARGSARYGSVLKYSVLVLFPSCSYLLGALFRLGFGSVLLGSALLCSAQFSSVRMWVLYCTQFLCWVWLGRTRT